MEKTILQLKEAIRGRMEEIIKEEQAEALARAHKRMSEAIPALSLEFCSWYSMIDMGHHIEIKVSKPEAK